MRSYNIVILLSACLLCPLSLQAQKKNDSIPVSAFERICQDRNFSASNYCIYPDTIEHVMTVPPSGKQPFYISHYGRHGSRYLNNRKGYDIPYNMLCKADSMGELTPTGKRILNRTPSQRRR